MIFAGILAGGTGTRMETAKKPKQFIDVCGVPIFIRCLNKFLNIKCIDKIFISTNPCWVSEYEYLLDKFSIDKTKIQLVEGGRSRFLSLTNIVKSAFALSHSNNDIIVVHDCARLFVSERIIIDNISLINNYDMVTTSIPVIDSILRSDDGLTSCGVLERSTLFADQGPQTFRVVDFIKYFNKIPMRNLDQYIEAGKLFAENHCKIGIVRGDRFNFKVTNDLDLYYSEFLLKSGVVK